MLCVIQIHLMLLFIKPCGERSGTWTTIQIHLMLLFIYNYYYYNHLKENSNTSHVIVYRSLLGQKSLWIFQFKYISCYCLSKAHILYLPIGSDSNTSHVIVYRLFTTRLSSMARFKYISCYCLSCVACPLNRSGTLFKYISCYCLSYSLQSYA